MDIKGTQTEKSNDGLRGRSASPDEVYFLFFAGEEGRVRQIANLFNETAENEKEHAKLWFKLLYNGIPTTGRKPLDAAAGEHYEWTEMYAEFARWRWKKDSRRLRKCSRAWRKSRKPTRNVTGPCSPMLKTTRFRRDDEETVWICTNCGHLHTGKTAPKSMPGL